MTDTEFERAYTAFMELPYPDYPQSDELRDWNSLLLTLDGYLAGYAYQVHAGHLRAAAIPELEHLVREVGSLRVRLDAIHPATEVDSRLIGDFLVYMEALHRMMRALAGIAAEGS